MDTPQPTLPPWDAIDQCVRGGVLLKFGRVGLPHFRNFFLTADLQALCWSSDKKSDAASRIALLGTAFQTGQRSPVFQRQLRPDLAGTCFSLLYTEPGTGAQRSLDIACKDAAEYAHWASALAYLSRFTPPQEEALEQWRVKGWARVTHPGAGGAGGGGGGSPRRRGRRCCVPGVTGAGGRRRRAGRF